MSHDHSNSTTNLKTAFFLNLAFTLIEIVGGLATNSIAILSDALHDGGDCVSLGLSWYLQNVSQRKASKTFTYGYQRFSPLGALITGTVLLAGMIVILFNAVPRLSDPQPVKPEGMIALAVLGIVVNGYAAFRASKGSSLNEGVVSWHLLEDVLGWIAVLVGSIAIKIWDLPIIDPILSIGISLFILFNVFRQLAKVAKVFMQRVPDGFDFEKFERQVLNLESVQSMHHAHVWSLDGEHHVMTTHLVLDSNISRDRLVEIKKSVYDLVKESGFEHLTVEIELVDEECYLEREDH